MRITDEEKLLVLQQLNEKKCRRNVLPAQT